MKRNVAVTLVFIGLCSSAVVFGQSSGGDFEITKQTIDNGGGVSTGGDFSLTGTIGQPDAGLRASSGGDFILAGGFWGRALDHIFSAGFERVTP